MLVLLLLLLLLLVLVLVLALVLLPYENLGSRSPVCLLVFAADIVEQKWLIS